MTQNYRSLFLGTLIVAFAPSLTLAQDAIKNPVCLDVVAAMNFALQGMPEDGVTGILLRDGGETTHLLFIVLSEQTKESTVANATPWRLLQRQSDSLSYCLVGAGKSMAVLEDPSFWKTGDSEFGLPGSSKRRCNDESDGPLGSVVVRAWAAKEMGPSIVQSLYDTFRGEAFTLLMANTPSQGLFPWILIQENSQKSCYFSRGSDSSITMNFKIRRDLTSAPGTLPRLEQ